MAVESVVADGDKVVSPGVRSGVRSALLASSVKRNFYIDYK